MHERHTIDMIATGVKIKYLIKQSCYSYEEIAQMLGFETPRVIYEWMRGNKKPSLESAYNLSLILNCKIEDLIVFEVRKK